MLYLFSFFWWLIVGGTGYLYHIFLYLLVVDIWFKLFSAVHTRKSAPGLQAGGGPWSVVKLEKPVTCTFLIGTSS